MNETFPPPNFVKVTSEISGIEVYAPAPEQPKPEAPVVEFKCPQCQATIAYSVADGGLRCAHCGYSEAPQREVLGKGAEEFEFTVDTVASAASDATLRARGWGETRKVLHCQNCNAQTSVPLDQLTHTCPFCGSNRVLQQEAAQDILRPRFLIPFAVDMQACHAIAREWLGRSWMTPKALQRGAVLTSFTGVYLPYWTFDALTKAGWKAQVGHQESERYYDSSSKSWKTRTKTVWRWESGHAQQSFDDLLVAGTSRLSGLLLGRLANFDTQALVAYEPRYLAGLMAQAYDVPLETAWDQGRSRMREATRQACRSQASTSQIRNFSMSMDFAAESWRYVLLPVYVTAYDYAGQTYQVMLNGQTGEIAGQRPVDWQKVWLAIAAMLAPAGIFALLGLPLLLLLPPLGVTLLVFAGLALLLGGIFALTTYQKAKGMDDV